MGINILVAKSLQVEDIDKALKEQGLQTIMEPCYVSLSDVEKRGLASLLGLNLQGTSSISSRMGIYYDEGNIVKVADLQVSYYHDPAILVYETMHEKTLYKVKTALSNALALKLLTQILKQDLNQIPSSQNYIIIAQDIARLGNISDHKPILTELLDNITQSVSKCVMSYIRGVGGKDTLSEKSECVGIDE